MLCPFAKGVKILAIKDAGENHFQNGLRFYEKGFLDKSIAEFREAVHLEPRRAELQWRLGLALYYKGNYGESIHAYQEAQRLDPTDARILSSLGTSLLCAKRFQDAIAAYQESLRLRPDDAATYYSLALALNQSGQQDEALVHLQKAVRLDPANAEMQYSLGGIFHNRRRFDEAIAHYQQALHIDPNHAAANEWLKRAQQENKAQQENRVTLASLSREWQAQDNEAMQKSSPFTRVIYERGVAAWHKGDRKTAIRELEAAIQIDPEFLPAYRLLSRLQFWSGQWRKGWKTGKLALDIRNKKIL